MGMAEEVFHHGLGVSPGIAYGPAYLITPSVPRVPRRTIEPDAIDEEVARLERAIEETSSAIDRVHSTLVEADKDSEAMILDTHRMILEDAALIESTRARIRDDRVNAEHAFFERTAETVRRLEQSENAYMRERVRDIRDLVHRVIRILVGEREPAFGDLVQNGILVAHDLSASLTAELDRERILGFATEIGAENSHTAILARALEIPAVIDLGPVLYEIDHEEKVILDGREGLLIQNPSDGTLAEYDRLRARIERKRAEWVSLADRPGVTADGTALTFFANVEFVREVDAALAFGCEGIGLYRTEYLFLQSGGDPGTEHQYRTYRELIERMDGRPVTLRTIDLGGDKLLAGSETEDNPYLGWRAIRYCLDRPEVFRAQLRAILRAGSAGPISLMIPMLTTLEEAEAALEHLESVRAELAEEGVDHAESCPVGALIETPAAALQAEQLADRFDFLSLGTNDLIQYTLAVDRGNRRVAHLYQPFHPAVLQLIVRVVEACADRGKPVTVCGEMGAHSREAALLLGLGLRRFSMVPARIPRIKQVLTRISIDEARETAEEALTVHGIEEVNEVIDRHLGDRFHDEPIEKRTGA